MGQNVKKNILGLFWGPWESLQWSDWAYLDFQLSSHPYLCTCEIRKQSDKKCLSLNPKYEKKYILFSYLGGFWGPYIEPRWTKIFHQCHQMQTSSQWRHMNNKGKQFENDFFFYGPKCKQNVYFGGILGALRGSSMIRLNLSCFPAILSPISMYMWNKEAIW